MNMIILYFAWADQRDKVYFIFHEVARLLYAMAMKTICLSIAHS